MQTKLRMLISRDILNIHRAYVEWAWHFLGFKVFAEFNIYGLSCLWIRLQCFCLSLCMSVCTSVHMPMCLCVYACTTASSGNDQIIAQFVSQHGKTWPYWFRKMGQYTSLCFLLFCIFLFFTKTMISLYYNNTNYRFFNYSTDLHTLGMNQRVKYFVFQQSTHFICRHCSLVHTFPTANSEEQL